jgi:hypothetical protein
MRERHKCEYRQIEECIDEDKVRNLENIWGNPSGYPSLDGAEKCIKRSRKHTPEFGFSSCDST